MTKRSFLLLLLIVPPIRAQVGLGLTPMKLEFPAAAGRSYSGTLSLNNSSDQKIRIRTEILDFYVDQNQTPQFMPNVPAESEFSCRQWVTVNPMEGEVSAHGLLPARYTVRVPTDVKDGSHHCAIGLVSVPTADGQQGFGVRTAIRVVTTLYPIVGNTAVVGSIAGLQLEPVKAGDKTQWRGVLTLANTGRLLYRPTGKVDVSDASGKVIETAQLASFPVLPNREQRFFLPLKSDLTSGSYTLHARIDLGHEVQEVQVNVAVPAGR